MSGLPLRLWAWPLLWLLLIGGAVAVALGDDQLDARGEPLPVDIVLAELEEDGFVPGAPRRTPRATLAFGLEGGVLVRIGLRPDRRQPIEPAEAGGTGPTSAPATAAVPGGRPVPGRVLNECDGARDGCVASTRCDAEIVVRRSYYLTAEPDASELDRVMGTVERIVDAACGEGNVDVAALAAETWQAQEFDFAVDFGWEGSGPPAIYIPMTEARSGRDGGMFELLVHRDPRSAALTSRWQLEGGVYGDEAAPRWDQDRWENEVLRACNVVIPVTSEHTLPSMVGIDPFEHRGGPIDPERLESTIRALRERCGG